jgi:hypothetical protein
MYIRSTTECCQSVVMLPAKNRNGVSRNSASPSDLNIIVPLSFSFSPSMLSFVRPHKPGN